MYVPLGLAARGPEGVIALVVFMGGLEPRVKRAVSFVDGQNLYHHAKAAFGYRVPNYDPLALAQAVCDREGWSNVGVRFYTGVPLPHKNPKWHRFWQRRLLKMRHRGIETTERPLHYVRAESALGARHGSFTEIAHEKGIDIRIALDVIRLASEDDLDVAILFAQDQDYEEVAREVRRIAERAERWIKIASAFPKSVTATSHRGINRTDWKPFSRSLYDACLDPTNYFDP